MKKKILLLPCLALASLAIGQVTPVEIEMTTMVFPDGGFGSGSCVVDMNGDKLDDAVIVSPGEDRLTISYQQADGTYVVENFDVEMQYGPTWSICAADVDQNGYTDILLADWPGASILYANDDGTAFNEVVLDNSIASQRSTFADIDNDGDIDAFVCHDVDQSVPFRNDGNGNFTMDQSLIETEDSPGNYAAIWVDFDNDWDTDLYVTKCIFGSQNPEDQNRINKLYVNNGDGTYTEASTAAGLDDNAQGWVSVFEDFDNDGDFDNFIVNHDFQNRFFENNGDGTFTDIIMSTGIDPDALGSWENSSGDFNNDGFVDIIAENSDELYLNNGDGTFTGQDLPVGAGGIGDLNNDGFLDIMLGNTVFFNETNDNNYVKVALVGQESNIDGIGARVEIHGDWGIQIREVRAGQAFRPMSSLTAHFGIGTAESIDEIVIKWPSGVQTTIEDPAINDLHIVVEEEGIVLGVENQTSEQLTLGVFPNPANEAFFVNLDSQKPQLVQLTVTDTFGKVVLSQNVQSTNGINQHRVDTKGLANGIYVLNATANGTYVTQKIIIE